MWFNSDKLEASYVASIDALHAERAAAIHRAAECEQAIALLERKLSDLRKYELARLSTETA